MRRTFLTEPTGLLVVLLAFTLITFGLAEGSQASRNVIGCLVLFIGFVKLRLVGVHFMEIGNAPLVLRALFELYVVGTCGALITLYLVTG